MSSYIKAAQKPIAITQTPLFGLLKHFAMQAFGMEGYYPRPYPSWLQWKKSVATTDARLSEFISALQEADNRRLASRIIGLVKKDDEAIETASIILNFLYYISPDTADAVLYPVGSMRELGASIGGIIIDIAPEIDRETARRMSEHIVEKIREDFYNRHVISDVNRSILTNGGFTAGRFGEVYMSLVNAGMLDPRWDWESQKAVLSKFVPAISAIVAYRRQQGQDVGILDAVRIASEFNSSLAAAQQDNSELTRKILQVMEVNKLMLERVGSAKPGALPMDAATELHMKLLNRAGASQGVRYLAMIRAASKYAKPGSPVQQMADKISRGIPPVSDTKDLYSITTSDGLYNLMIESGVSPKAAWTLISNPILADQYKDYSVVLAARAMQRYEILRTIEMYMAAAAPNVKRLPPDLKPLALQAAKLYALRHYGIENEAQFEQLHGRLSEGELARAMQRAEERLRRPPEPDMGLGRIIGRGLSAVEELQPKTPLEALKAFAIGAFDITSQDRSQAKQTQSAAPEVPPTGQPQPAPQKTQPPTSGKPTK